MARAPSAVEQHMAFENEIEIPFAFLMKVVPKPGNQLVQQHSEVEEL